MIISSIIFSGVEVSVAFSQGLSTPGSVSFSMVMVWYVCSSLCSDVCVLSVFWVLSSYWGSASMVLAVFLSIWSLYGVVLLPLCLSGVGFLVLLRLL